MTGFRGVEDKRAGDGTKGGMLLTLLSDKPISKIKQHKGNWTICRRKENLKLKPAYLVLAL